MPSRQLRGFNFGVTRASAPGEGPGKLATVTTQTTGTPSIVLGTAAAAGSASTAVRTDGTIAAFDTTVPTTSALADAAAVGSVAFAARRDHVHGRESFATPAIVLGTAAAAGSAATPVRSNSTIAAFDATVPVTQASADAAATGSAAFAARRDHKHGMPTLAPVATSGTASVATLEATTSTSYTNLATTGPAVTLSPGRTTDQVILFEVMATNNTLGAATLASVAIAGATATNGDALQLRQEVASDIETMFGHILAASVADGSTHTVKYRVNTGTGTYGQDVATKGRRITAYTLT